MDRYVCSVHPEHVHPFFTGAPEDPATFGKAWWVSPDQDQAAPRLYGDHDNPQSETDVCGHPAADHPTNAERSHERTTGSCGKIAELHVTVPDGVDAPGLVTDHPFRSSEGTGPLAGEPRCTFDTIEHLPVWHHTHIGDPDGPCQHPVALVKLIGFRCTECGAPIEGMPTKDV